MKQGKNMLTNIRRDSQRYSRLTHNTKFGN